MAKVFLNMLRPISLYGFCVVLVVLGSGSLLSNSKNAASQTGISQTATKKNVTKNQESLIFVDQFGYRPQDRKIAVAVGVPETNPPYKVLNTASGEILEVIKPVPWNQGQVHEQSGQRAWWVDFSEVKEAGNYVLVSADDKVRSPEFEIREDIYNDILVAATRMFFYQRSGFDKVPPYADEKWTESAAYLGPNQDTEARYVNRKTDSTLAKDMRGGWFDAGDTNKYVTFALSAVHQLLSAYDQRPEIWTDDFNIPESGNGIPDLLDEIKYELDWLLRMQDDDGGAFIKLGILNSDINLLEGDNSLPSQDITPRYYGPKCSSSTIAAASMFAHAAWSMKDIPELSHYAETLNLQAESAWQWFQTNPLDTDCDSGEIRAGDADMTAEEQVGTAVSAAVYLFALTQDPQYNNYIAENIESTQPFQDSVWSRYHPSQGDALLFYTELDNADADLKATIKTTFTDIANNNFESGYGNDEALDPYQAHMPDDRYHWGSNSVKANYGNSNYDLLLFNITPTQSSDYRNRAASTLHYFHGLNPLGIVYLTNMYAYGAENSANEMSHHWLGEGPYKNALTSKHGPAPGFLTGGPNHHYSGPLPLAAQPPMLAYADTNDDDVAAWEITEPAIYYQAAYVKLLSKFVSPE